MLKIFSRLKITSELHNINENSSGWVNIDEFFSPKYANQKNAEQVKNWLSENFGPNYEQYFYQDGESNLTRSLEQKLTKSNELTKSKLPVHFGNNMVDCRIWEFRWADKKFYLLQFDEPKTPPTKMLLGTPEDLKILED